MERDEITILIPKPDKPEPKKKKETIKVKNKFEVLLFFSIFASNKNRIVKWGERN